MDQWMERGGNEKAAALTMRVLLLKSDGVVQFLCKKRTGVNPTRSFYFWCYSFLLLPDIEYDVHRFP